MRGLRSFALLVLCTGALVVACDRDEESGGFATAPDLASAAGQCRNNTLNAAVSNAFTNNTTRQNVQSFAQEMVKAFGDGNKGRATWFG